MSIANVDDFDDLLSGIYDVKDFQNHQTKTTVCAMQNRIQEFLFPQGFFYSNFTPKTDYCYSDK